METDASFNSMLEGYKQGRIIKNNDAFHVKSQH